MAAPFFSIIIPTYNCEKHIAKSLLSIINQKFAAYEIIIQDGLSNDKTIETINQVHSQHSHVPMHVFAEKDAGIYDAMNKALKRAQGEWIYFLGSDDYLLSENILQDIHAVASRQNAEMIYGNVKWGNTEIIYGGKFSLEKLFERNICHQSIFYKKTVFEKYGLFDLKYPLLADWDFNCTLFKKKAKILYTDLTIAFFNLGEGVSAVNDKDPFYEKLKRMQEAYYQSFQFKVNFHKRRFIAYLNTAKQALFKKRLFG